MSADFETHPVGTARRLTDLQIALANAAGELGLQRARLTANLEYVSHEDKATIERIGKVLDRARELIVT